MADIDGAIGYVVAHGDPVDRARLSYLRSGLAPPADVLAKAELDDLGALHREPARRALAWLAGRQRPDGCWEEDAALADTAPDWARPGDPEARLYLTANAGT